MAHAIFNVSPIKFLTSIQDHVFTATPSFKNKLYRQNNNEDKQQHQQGNSSSSPVTFQLTYPTDSNMDQELSQQLLQQEIIEIPSCSEPIDIPKSYPFNVPNNTDYNGEGLMPHNNMPSTALYDNHNLINLANGIPNNTQSPHLPADDLTLCFDGLAVKSPTGSYYSHQNSVYSPQQIHSPINIGSPHSPIYFGSPQSPHYGNTNFLANDAQQQYSFVGSPHSAHFVSSPALTPFMNDHNHDHNGFNSYLSPIRQQKYISPINSPSPTGSCVGQNYLFPPTALQTRPSSPVPDDVILTASEVHDYINSPYLSPSVASASASPAPIGLTIHTDVNYSAGADDASEFLFGNTTGCGVTPASRLTTSNSDDMELFPSAVKRSSPQTQTYTKPHSSVEDDDDEYENKNATSSVKKTTPSGRKAKIHKCPYCHHTSNRANNMREHVQIHNPNRPKPHACKLCSRAFARKHDMNRHYTSCKKQYNA